MYTCKNVDLTWSLNKNKYDLYTFEILKMLLLSYLSDS